MRSGHPMVTLLVIAIAAGASICSHVNDSGFWLVNRYLGQSVTQTLMTWTATTTIAALVMIALAHITPIPRIAVNRGAP